jgi:hypothetical protein
LDQALAVADRPIIPAMYDEAVNDHIYGQE